MAAFNPSSGAKSGGVHQAYRDWLDLQVAPFAGTSSYRIGRVQVAVGKGPLETPCHVWDGHRNNCGYACRTVDKRPVLVHRWVYETLAGPIPDGWHVHHRCENRACVNPDHLESVAMLAHNREHFPGPAAQAEALLRERGPLRIGEIAEAIGCGSSALRVGLSRSIRGGRAVRVARGVYGPPNDVMRRGIPFTREGE